MIQALKASSRYVATAFFIYQTGEVVQTAPLVIKTSEEVAGKPAALGENIALASAGMAARCLCCVAVELRTTSPLSDIVHSVISTLVISLHVCITRDPYGGIISGARISAKSSNWSDQSDDGDFGANKAIDGNVWNVSDYCSIS